MLSPCPVAYGTGHWDATECLVARLGRAWVGRLRVGTCVGGGGIALTGANGCPLGR